MLCYILCKPSPVSAGLLQYRAKTSKPRLLRAGVGALSPLPTAHPDHPKNAERRRRDRRAGRAHVKKSQQKHASSLHCQGQMRSRATTRRVKK